MLITKCISPDVDEVLELYEFARRLQRERKMLVWPHFDKSFLQKEIADERQWKIVIAERLACNWAITYEDKEIWEGRDNNNGVYIHRIAAHPDFRGSRFIDDIVRWAKQHAKEKGRPFVRLDTVSNNTRLIEHYTSAGFEFLGMLTLTNTATLPLHYQQQPNRCLFEMRAF